MADSSVVKQATHSHISQWLPVWYHIHIWQVSPQLSCGDTWRKYERDLKYLSYDFWKIKISRDGEIIERSFSNPQKPGAA